MVDCVLVSQMRVEAVWATNKVAEKGTKPQAAEERRLESRDFAHLRPRLPLTGGDC